MRFLPDGRIGSSILSVVGVPLNTANLLGQISYKTYTSHWGHLCPDRTGVFLIGKLFSRWKTFFSWKNLYETDKCKTDTSIDEHLSVSQWTTSTKNHHLRRTQSPKAKSKENVVSCFLSGIDQITVINFKAYLKFIITIYVNLHKNHRKCWFWLCQ